MWIIVWFVSPRESSNNHRDSHHYNSHRGHYGGGQHNGNNSAADRGAGPERRGLAGGKQSFASQSSSISSNNTTNNNVSNNQHHQTALPGILTFSCTSHIRPFLQLHSTRTHSSVSVSSLCALEPHVVQACHLDIMKTQGKKLKRKSKNKQNTTVSTKKNQKYNFLSISIHNFSLKSTFKTILIIIDNIS